MDPDPKLDQLSQQMMGLAERWQKNPPTGRDAPIVQELLGYLDQIRSSVAEGEKKLKAKTDAIKAKVKQALIKPPVPPVPSLSLSTGQHAALLFEKQHAPPLDKVQEAITFLLPSMRPVPASTAQASEGKPKVPDLNEVQQLLRKMGLVK